MTKCPKCFVIAAQSSVVFYKNSFNLIFIRCLVRISMFGGIFVFQGLNGITILASIPGSFAMSSSIISPSAHLNSLLLNFSPCSFGVPTTASFSLYIFLFFFLPNACSQTSDYDILQALRKKRIIMHFHSLTLSIHFSLSTPSSSTSLGALLENFRLNVLTHVVLASPYHLHEPLVLLQLT